MLDMSVIAFSLVYLNCLSYILNYNGSKVHTKTAASMQYFRLLQLAAEL